MVLWGYDTWKDRVELGNRGAALRQNGGIFSVFAPPCTPPCEGHFGAGLVTRRAIKTGDCVIHIRPRGIETGHYPLGLAELGHSRNQSRPLIGGRSWLHLFKSLVDNPHNKGLGEVPCFSGAGFDVLFVQADLHFQESDPGPRTIV
jgi:hypothetical protein